MYVRRLRIVNQTAQPGQPDLLLAARDKLRILHVLDHSLPLHSGYAFRSQNILTCQKLHGLEPIALTSSKHEENLTGGTEPEETVDGFTFQRSGEVTMRGSVAREIALMRRLYYRLSDIIKAQKPAVLHAHSPVLNALPALWAGRRHGLPVVYELRAFWEDAAVSHGSYDERSYKYKLVSAAETFVCRRADHVVVLCDGIRADLLRRGVAESRITVVPNAVDTGRFRVCPPTKELRDALRPRAGRAIGFLGSFYAYEGLDLLLDALAEIVKERPDVTLVLVGGGLMEPQLRAQTRRLNLDEHVVFAGRMPNDKIPMVYGLLDLVVCPRQSIRLTELVTPLKPLEAMAMGVPCIASNVGGHRELIIDGQTGMLFPPGDAGALARTILDLIDNESMKAHLRSNGRAFVTERRTWEHTTARYADVYESVLDARSAAG